LVRVRAPTHAGDTDGFSATWPVALQVIGAVAGIGSLLYFTGAAILWLRFSAIGLEPDRAAALVPREVGFAVGARTVAKWVALAAAQIVHKSSDAAIQEKSLCGFFPPVTPRVVTCGLLVGQRSDGIYVSPFEEDITFVPSSDVWELRTINIAFCVNSDSRPLLERIINAFTGNESLFSRGGNPEDPAKKHCPT
jgi:hypothetical protein